MAKRFQEIHLFGEVWTIGKLNYLSASNRAHTIIRQPREEGGMKEHHVHDQQAMDLFGENKKKLSGRP